MDDRSTADFVTPRQFVHLGFPPGRIDLLTTLSGLSWDEAVNYRVAADYYGTPVAYIGKEQYRINKKASGRPQDIADIASLKKLDK